MSTSKETTEGFVLYRRSYQLNGKTIILEPTATIALETFSSDEAKRQVTEAIHQLAYASEAELADNVKKLPTTENWYLMSVDDWRIIYEVNGDVFDIMDVFHKKRLEVFKRKG